MRKCFTIITVLFMYALHRKGRMWDEKVGCRTNKDDWASHHRIVQSHILPQPFFKVVGCMIVCNSILSYLTYHIIHQSHTPHPTTNLVHPTINYHTLSILQVLYFILPTLLNRVIHPTIAYLVLR